MEKHHPLSGKTQFPAFVTAVSLCPVAQGWAGRQPVSLLLGVTKQIIFFGKPDAILYYWMIHWDLVIVELTFARCSLGANGRPLLPELDWTLNLRCACRVLYLNSHFKERWSIAMTIRIGRNYIPDHLSQFHVVLDARDGSACSARWIHLYTLLVWRREMISHLVCLVSNL